MQVGPSQDSSHLDFKSLKVYNVAFNYPKKIPISKDELEQNNNQQTKPILNNSKDDKLNSSIKSTDNKINNISYDYIDGHLIDKIFNDLIKNGYDNNSKQNKYLVQIAEKFWLFKPGLDKIFFEICKRDLDNEPILLIEDYTKDCKTAQEKYLKLNGIMTEVIAAIAKQSEHLIISQTNGDLEWLKRLVNEVRECVSLEWKLMKGDIQSDRKIDDLIGYSYPSSDVIINDKSEDGNNVKEVESITSSKKEINYSKFQIPIIMMTLIIPNRLTITMMSQILTPILTTIIL